VGGWCGNYALGDNDIPLPPPEKSACREFLDLPARGRWFQRIGDLSSEGASMFSHVTIGSSDPEGNKLQAVCHSSKG